MISRYTGCLVGLAVGDALGAPVEFETLAQIKSSFGPEGITDLEPWDEFVAGSYTDDTQMSLAAAQGLLDAYRVHRATGRWDVRKPVYREYQKWRNSQSNPLNRKSPGLTCLLALKSDRMGTIEEPLNDSKGCGGVMRTAPAGLVFKPGHAFRAGAEFAAMTHGHPSGYLPAGFLSEIVSRMVSGEGLGRAVARAIPMLKSYRGHEETLARIGLALKLYTSTKPSRDLIKKLGEGWTGDEALAISLFCALRNRRDFRQGVLDAVNQEGDSDSTGSITGAILGTAVGLEGIPEDWVHRLQNHGKILDLAQALESAYGPSGRITLAD